MRFIYEPPRGIRWDMEDAKKKLKLKSKVECKTFFGEDEDKSRGKRMKGEVIEKFTHHFLVRLKTKKGTSWIESFTYDNLLPDDKGNAVVTVLKKGIAR